MEKGRKEGSESLKEVVSWAHSKVPGIESFASFLRLLVEKRFAILFAIAAIVLLFFSGATLRSWSL